MTAPTSNDSAKVRILAVDDEVMNLELIQRSLRRRYQVLMAESAESALAILAGEPGIAVVLTDFRMPGTNGAELLAAVMRTHPDTKRVIITGYADIDALSAAISSGQVHYVIKKPWKHPELHQLLDQLVDAYLLGRENRKLADSLRLVNDELRAKSGRADDEPAQSSADLPAPGGGPGQPSRAEPGHPVAEVIAYKDTLTGLYASGAFQEHVREEVARSLRHGQSVSLLIGDIDSFSAVNKELGYRSGDEVLCRIARMLTEEPGIRVRESDVAARYGGEEIALLLPETGKAGAMVKANRLREAIARIALPNDRRLTISFGIATVPDDASTAHDLCRRAEAAVRAAKHAGGDQVHTCGEVIEASEPSQPGALAARTGLAAMPVGEGMFRTYHECVGEIATLLSRSGSVACLYVDLGWLRRLALEAGPAYHADVYDRAGMALEELMSPVFEHGDLVCRADDAYVCVIAPKRHRPMDASGLARLAIEVEGGLNHLLSADASRFLRDQPRVIVGQARILENALIRPDELVKRLLDEARNMADLRRKRAVLRDKAMLQEVIVGRAITPVYQPIVDLASGDLLGYEALARGPRQSPLESPSSLFRIAHEADLAFELDRICFAAALEHAQGFDPGRCLFVNVLPLMLHDTARLERTIATWFESAALGPHNLVFEISERSAIQSFSEFRRALAACTSQGYRIAIDDVGTRHTDLEAITALQPAYLKASEVVTRGAARSTVKREMLSSLAHVAAVTEAVIVAQGIETADDLAVLQELGIRYGQGYYLARPGPPFVRLPSSIKRALCGLAEAPRMPIAALSADEPVRAFATAPGTYMMFGSGVRDHETPTSAVSSPVAISTDRRDTNIMDQSPSSDHGSSAPASAENPTDEDGVHN